MNKIWNSFKTASNTQLRISAAIVGIILAFIIGGINKEAGSIAIFITSWATVVAPEIRGFVANPKKSINAFTTSVVAQSKAMKPQTAQYRRWLARNGKHA